MGGTTTRLHWTDQPYRWDVNDGEEVFAVLDGTVDMHYRESGIEHVVALTVGDVFLRKLGVSMSRILAERHGFWLSNVRAAFDSANLSSEGKRNEDLEITRPSTSHFRAAVEKWLCE